MSERYLAHELISAFPPLYSFSAWNNDTMVSPTQLPFQKCVVSIDSDTDYGGTDKVTMQ